ncbi:1,6-anhydro-N-acetylmuramyl-L-alanine amidase AmpD [Idiomarina tyrosinivorans]|uniref:1,6-anhydro-N-acetylmuramyl-L-alanine amidase AmpD n=1 Tax=Idiomarina tyrosinivorans TaxID=1445662 RepID=A0A432ZQE8_9GAMM|nr:1,6-anhydro-N-acetylmuramyl-L-alanine amidase AmpD [Idiomarina tyrosinivorans]RUO80061.1 1,6-anhydro-N-acetylmuramyl-L-alanine amidase AmpD [Idiomarina tyrosinivorans]
MKSYCIENHCLTGVEQRPSPHFDQRPNTDDISLLVIHSISLPAGEFALPHIDELFMGQLDTGPESGFEALAGLRVSAHLVIHRDGRVVQYVPFNQRAWHAGKSRYCGRKRCNDYAIGIELEGTDDTPYTEQQYQSLIAVSKALLAHYPQLTRRRIVGHQHIAPGRKTDPGPAFNWSHYLAAL